MMDAVNPVAPGQRFRNPGPPGNVQAAPSGSRNILLSNSFMDVAVGSQIPMTEEEKGGNGGQRMYQGSNVSSDSQSSQHPGITGHALNLMVHITFQLFSQSPGDRHVRTGIPGRQELIMVHKNACNGEHTQFWRILLAN